MKNTALISFIFILVFGFSLMPAGTTNVSADTDSEDSSKDNGNSGGFIIETKKVDGQMDLVGALQGKVKIKEGVIHGLTITKVLETGGEQEPMVIRIKSPGPIHVQNLYAETIDGTPPNIGGLCAPSKVGWVCLTNVVMKVSKQTVSDISLPNTKIEACYKSECGKLPDYSPTTKEKIKEILEEEQEEQSKLDQIKEELENDKQKLGAVGELIDKATETYEKVKNGTPSDELVNLIEDTKNLLKKEIEDGVTDKLNNLVALTERMEKELQSFQDVSGTFSSLVDESSRLVKDLENSINTKQEKLTKLTEKHSPANESEREQAEVFSKLLEMTETNNDGAEAKSDETESNETTKSEIDIKTIKESVEKVTKETEEVKEKVNSLKVKEESIQKKTSTITDSITSLKDSITETEKKASSEEKEKTDSNTDENATDNKKEETETESESDNETDPNSNDTTDEENDGDSSQDEETTELEDVVESIFDLFQVRLIIP